MSRPRQLNRPRTRALKPSVAMVEGTEGGIPFRVFMKQLPAAKNLAYRTRGTWTDLRTLERWRYIGGEWHKV